MKAIVFLLAILAAPPAFAQTVRLKPRSDGTQFHGALSGVVTVATGWRDDTDPAGWFDGLPGSACIRPRAGEYLIGASLQWSMQSPDPQRGTREIQFWRLPAGNSAPVLLDSFTAAPSPDFVTKHGGTVQTSVVAGDCIYVAGHHTGGVPIGFIGTSFWAERIGASARTAIRLK